MAENREVPPREVTSEVAQALAIIDNVIRHHIEGAKAGDADSIEVCRKAVSLVATILALGVRRG